MGGQVALIIDNPPPEWWTDKEPKKEEGVETLPGEDTPEGDEENKEEEIPDWIIFDATYDGTGSSVHIPTVIITHAQGLELINVMRNQGGDR